MDGTRANQAQDGPANAPACDPDRRTACKACIAGMGVLAVGMVGFPVASFLAPPESLELNKPLEVPLDRLTPGQAHYVEYRGQQLVLLAAQDKPKVFSASCPHLGCNVTWDPADAVFRCPCHGAIFNASGQVVRGPVSAPLRSVSYEQKDGKVVISSEV